MHSNKDLTDIRALEASGLSRHYRPPLVEKQIKGAIFGFLSFNLRTREMTMVYVGDSSPWPRKE